MFWGCVAFTGLGDLVPVDGTMNQGKYLDVLNNHAFPSGDKLIGESFIHQQDIAPWHKAKLITKLLKDVGVNTLDWPRQSPDLNIIENLWSYLKRKRSANLSRSREETILEIQTLYFNRLYPQLGTVCTKTSAKGDAKGGYIFLLICHNFFSIYKI